MRQCWFEFHSLNIWCKEPFCILSHATVLDIKVCYYLRNVIFHSAAGRVEYYHSKGSNKPDIQHSRRAIFVLLYPLHYRRKLCQGFEDRDYALSKTTLSHQPQRKATMTVQTCLALACWHSRMMTLLARKGLASHSDIRLATSLSANFQHWFCAFPLVQWHQIDI